VTGPTPSPEPAAGVPAEAEDGIPADPATDAADTGADPAAAPPANRAERRARKSGQPPTHTGPQSAEHTRRGKGPRSHTKRV
jgi:hypothetical protein